jgi:hypothetical protein
MSAPGGAIRSQTVEMIRPRASTAARRWVTGTFGLVAASVVVREPGESVIDRTNRCDPWAHPAPAAG